MNKSKYENTINSYFSDAHNDTYETRIRHYFKNMSTYYTNKSDLSNLTDNIFIYYFIISVESCDNNKKVDVVLSDPNFYFYKNEQQKPKEYQSIDKIREKIKSEFVNTLLKHPHFSPIDYVVIEKYTNDATTNDRYFLMKTRDFENTFCYVEKIKTTLRTSDVVDIMTILIMSKDTSSPPRGGGKLYTDVSVQYKDDDPVYYIQYQLLQRLGLDTYNTIAKMIQDNKPFTTKYTSSHKTTDGINKELFNNNTITTRFTKICHSDTDQYVAYLHNTLKEHIITEELMIQMYNAIIRDFKTKTLVFDSYNEKALIITYIQLLIEKWIDLYITIELNKELYESTKIMNNESTDVNNYMINQSSCKIDIIKYQLTLLYYLLSLQKSLNSKTINEKLPKIEYPPDNNFVNKIDDKIKKSYSNESYFHKLKTQFENVLKPDTGTTTDLTDMNDTLTAWLKTMKIQEDVIEQTIKVVNSYMNPTQPETRNFDTFKTDILKIQFGKTDMTSVNTETDQSTVNAISDETATGVSANAVGINQFITQTLVGLVYTASISKTTEDKIDTSKKGKVGTTAQSKPAKTGTKTHTRENVTQPITPRNVKTVDIISKENKVVGPTSDVSETVKNIVKQPVKATSPEEIIQRIVDPIKSKIEADKNTKIELIKADLSKVKTQIEEHIPIKRLTDSDTDIEVEDLDNSSDIDNDTTVSEQEEDKVADTKFYQTIKSQANERFDKNKHIDETLLEINKQMTKLKETLNEIHINRKPENEKAIQTAKKEIIEAINAANQDINEAIKTANQDIDNAIETAINKHKTEKDTKPPQEKKTPPKPKQTKSAWGGRKDS